MKRFTTILVGITITFTASCSFSGSHWESVRIEQISSNAYDTIRIKLDKSAASACSSKRVLLLPTFEGRINPLLSRAMFAYSTGEKIQIYGSGQCQGEFEIVRAISPVNSQMTF